ncbi:Glyoxylase, beta-lactamase superfamily II [Roseovarius nanhaiticus]|uniref:Glyoxylase, beta-lactamase superfamily II n=1 Tax=Roseovarius nanhaiticus TaxID=573024 RepID=A0A1N7HIG2_9RHOB|nr:MBL fold metallo-hydrolase [Roseovarius nanhaiticus]SEK91943.1 Glyoxylase, beta-lactamase superfamily II [Roseovarius nanhaiticus]SIS24676.1 Glyoxylase, beta-lactamase superfamily II [Roseovarius nanhaiticus]
MPPTAPEFDPQPGVPHTLNPALRRILAPNPSPMTFRGTNTYLLGTRGIAVIDPGPDDAAHLGAILNALTPGQHITHIFVTHAHRDHSPLARPLAEATGAPVLAFGDAQAGRSPVMARLAAAGTLGGGEGVDTAFRPDRALADDEIVSGEDWALRALWTPGHFGNHMCFATDDAIFTGDLVMGWASSLVSPPDGDAAAFVASCKRLLGLSPAILHPGHGAPVSKPEDRMTWLIENRAAREAAILVELTKGAADAPTLARALYRDIPAKLLPAATRNVLAHLIDLSERGEVAPHGALDAGSVFTRRPAKDPK